MRKTSILLATLLLFGCSPPSRTTEAPLRGRWEGIVELPNKKTRVIVDFSQDARGPLSAAVSLPDDRLLAKPLVRVEYVSSHLHFELPAPEGRIVFDGSRSGNVISGTVHAGDIRAPLSLLRTGDVPPTPYTQEEVSFRNGGVTLVGTLLTPPTKGRHPAVVLIHGSSTPSRNDFRFYGDLFARRGVAALIYDKREVGGDLGGASRVDLRDLAADALAAVELLKGRDDINPRQIGLWGHSQGGWVAPIVAAQSRDVAFVITFSGPGVTYSELNTYADVTRLRAQGFSEAEVREAAEALTQVEEYVRGGGNRQVLQRLLDKAWRKRWASHTTLVRRVPSEDDIHSWLQWRNLDLDPAVYWERVEVPVLALFGELDDVVPVRASTTRIEAALRRGRNKDFTIRVFPKANHTIQPAPDFLNTMIDWTLLRVSVR